jgi:hypothetical protein
MKSFWLQMTRTSCLCYSRRWLRLPAARCFCGPLAPCGPLPTITCWHCSLQLLSMDTVPLAPTRAAALHLMPPTYSSEVVHSYLVWFYADATRPSTAPLFPKG